MNNERRKTLSALCDQVKAAATAMTEALATHRAAFEGIKEALEGERDAEQESFDNLPESLQQGERGQNMEAAVSSLEEAISTIEEMLSTIEGLEGFDADGLIQQIDEARGQ